MSRGASRAVAMFMQSRDFAPAAKRLARRTEVFHATVVTKDNNKVTLDTNASGDRVIAVEMIKEDEDTETEAVAIGTRKAILAADSRMVFKRDIWSFAHGRVSWMRSNYAHHISWKVNGKRRRQYA